MISRRNFIRTVLIGSVGSGCLSGDILHPLTVSETKGGRSIETQYLSEHYSICHRVRDGHQFPSPPVSRRVNVAIIGGGPSGLVAAYRLRDRNIILLEKEPSVGGNARADHWKGMPYANASIASYGISPTMSLYEELGLEPQKLTTVGGATLYGDTLVEDDLWGSALTRIFSPSIERAILAAKKEILAIEAEKEKDKLDKVPFSDLLASYPSEVVEWFDDLLRFFGGTSNQYSAYVGLLLARSQINAGLGILYPEGRSGGGVYTFPGGLSGAALALKAGIERSGEGRVITGATVYRVTQDDNGVLISYLLNNTPITIRADFAIMASPKFITHHLVAGLPEDQAQAMQEMHYIPYLVGAVCVRGNITSDVRYARVLNGPIVSFRDSSTVDDLQLLRIEIPLKAYLRGALLTEDYLSDLADEIADYFDRVFPGSKKRIEEIRLWRRGHNWYIPIPRMVTQIQPLASQPFGRIFFANADSLGPISEFGWAMKAAETAVNGVEKLSAVYSHRSQVHIG